MILQPAIYALINIVPFVPPTNPGLIAVYPSAYAPTAQVKAIDAQFKLDKNMYKTYINIQRAVFKILTDNVRLEYQSLNMPGLTGWNQSMSIQTIFAQLDSTFGKPDAQAVLANDALYRTALASNETPESLFRRLEECQEVQILAENPYTDKQLMVHAVLLLRQSMMYRQQDFDNWEAANPKMWALLKTHFHTAFTKRLNMLSLNWTSGAYVYSNPNQFAAFGADDDSTDTANTSHTLANVTMSTIGATTM